MTSLSDRCGLCLGHRRGADGLSARDLPCSSELPNGECLYEKLPEDTAGLCTIKQAAVVQGVSHTTIRKLIWEGTVKAYAYRHTGPNGFIIMVEAITLPCNREEVWRW